jgi:hypothetical protein
MTAAPLPLETMSRVRSVHRRRSGCFHLIIIICVWMFMLGFVLPAISSPVGIVVHQAQHRLDLQFHRWVLPFDNPGTNIHWANHSSTPISATINTNPFTGAAALFATASSDVLGVSAFAPEPYPNDPLMASIRVSVTNELEFSPVQGGTNALSIFFAASGHWFDCSSGNLTLVDLTTATEVWNLGWFYASDEFFGDPAPEMYPNEINVSLPVNTSFISGHFYKLTMHTEVWADNSPRSPQIHLGLLGLEPVSVIPEPSSLAIIALGALAGLRLRRSRVGRPGMCLR